MLILDGHSSHVNMKFVKWADSHGIILLILPPHTTHRLQPLDVGLFQPLFIAYSKELDNLMNDSGAHVSMSKILFYPIFRVAWNASFTKENILHAWEKAGIWPLEPDLILSQITRPSSPPPQYVPDYLKTPQSSKTIGQFQKSYLRFPTNAK